MQSNSGTSILARAIRFSRQGTETTKSRQTHQQTAGNLSFLQSKHRQIIMLLCLGQCAGCFWHVQSSLHFCNATLKNRVPCRWLPCPYRCNAPSSGYFCPLPAESAPLPARSAACAAESSRRGSRPVRPDSPAERCAGCFFVAIFHGVAEIRAVPFACVLIAAQNPRWVWNGYMVQKY